MILKVYVIRPNLEKMKTYIATCKTEVECFPNNTRCPPGIVTIHESTTAPVGPCPLFELPLKGHRPTKLPIHRPYGPK